MRFFAVVSADEARRLLDRPTPAPASEEVSPVEGAGRVLAADVTTPIALPEFPRAVVDGFAVRAADTFGASPGAPAYLTPRGEVLMGRAAVGTVGPGECFRIATGGMVPEGADAVVMVEHTDAAGDLVEVTRAAAPGDGLVLPGDDARAGEVLVPAGRRLRPADVAALLAAGIPRVSVFAPPWVAVIATGDEVVPADRPPGPGQVRDVNSGMLAAALLGVGCRPRTLPIVPDDPTALRAAVEEALVGADLVLLAGGSSVGTRDLTLDVLTGLPGAQLLFHGVAVRPGKPVLAVAMGSHLVVGLPGNPVSALLVFEYLLGATLRRLTGETADACGRPTLHARLTRAVASDAGKEDYVRVRLQAGPEGLAAEPLLGKSTLLLPLARADGVIVIPAGVEGLEAGEWVAVHLRPRPGDVLP